MRVAAALALLALACAAAAQEVRVSRVDLQQCGVYESTVDRREDDAQSASGKRTIVQDNRLVDETSRIPARAGIKFGCQIVLQGAPAGRDATFRAVLRLPPGGPRETLSGSQTYPIGDAGYVGYTVRNADYAVRGPWMLEIWVDGRKLAEKAFTLQ